MSHEKRHETKEKKCIVIFTFSWALWALWEEDVLSLAIIIPSFATVEYGKLNITTISIIRTYQRFAPRSISTQIDW